MTPDPPAIPDAAGGLPAPTGRPTRGMSVAAVTALAVGGMMGAAPYMLLGLAAGTAGGLLPLSFLITGVVASLSVYSYAKLGTAFPSRGGAAEYLREGIGENTLSGGLNVFQYVAYVVAVALYAAGFAEYVAALADDPGQELRRIVAVVVVVVFAVVNLVGAGIVGRAESVIIAIEVVVLVAFAALALRHIEPSRIEQPPPGGWIGVLSASALLYVTYQGFGVATTAGGSMARPKRDLPRALYLALFLVAAVYLVISTLVVMLLDLSAHTDALGHLLADAGRAVAGQVGFVAISVAALLATASAVNATLFAAGNVGFNIAGKGEASPVLRRQVGRQGNVALVLASALVILLVLFFPLSAVGQMTSLAFLVVYGAVSYGHLRITDRTGARRGPLIAAIAANIVLFVLLLAEAVRTGPQSTWITLLVVLCGSFAYEAWFRRRRRAGQPAD